eukprot:8878699-Pyramimonas_sp.AAC.1
MGPRQLKRPTRPPSGLQETSRASPKRPKLFICIGFFKVLVLLAVSACRRSKRAEEAPKIATKRPKSSSREP